MRPLRLLLGAVFGLTASCTFGGLGDYQIETCNAHHQSQAEDECDRLNHGDTTTCTPLQCDAATTTCLAKPRDDDRDGDPSRPCGGADCDDTDAKNTGAANAVETCDFRDNNCNQVIDEGVAYVADKPVALEGAVGSGMGAQGYLLSNAGTHVVGAFVAAAASASTCVAAVNATVDNGKPGLLTRDGATCYFDANDASVLPTQPAVMLLQQGSQPNGAVALFVATSPGNADGCTASEALEYRWEDNNQNVAPATLDCANNSLGAALPTLAEEPTGEVLLLWTQTPSTERSSPISSCDSAKPAPLVVSVVSNARFPVVAPATTLNAPVVVAPSTVAMRPPSTATVTGFSKVLVATPQGDDVAIYAIDKTGAVSTVTASVPTLAKARSVSLGVAPLQNGSIPLALVAELGCSPQSIAIAFGQLDPLAGTATFQPSQDVSLGTSGAVQVAPSVAWVSQPGPLRPDGVTPFPNRTGWDVVWTFSQQTSQIYSRRYDAGGNPLSPATLFANDSEGIGYVQAVQGADGSVFVADASGASFDMLKPTCSP